MQRIPRIPRTPRTPPTPRVAQQTNTSLLFMYGGALAPARVREDVDRRPEHYDEHSLGVLERLERGEKVTLNDANDLFYTWMAASADVAAPERDEPKNTTDEEDDLAAIEAAERGESWFLELDKDRG